MMSWILRFALLPIEGRGTWTRVPPDRMLEVSGQEVLKNFNFFNFFATSIDAVLGQ